jgi:hypothetical protein
VTGEARSVSGGVGQRRRPGGATVQALGEVDTVDEDVLRLLKVDVDAAEPPGKAAADGMQRDLGLRDLRPRRAAGYRPAGMDNEGFEAEVFFQTGPYAAGQARVRWAGCEDRWNIDLVLIDPDAVPPRTT